MELPDILDIVLEYLKVLAWPIVVFTLALVYRRPVITLLQRLKKYSGWGQTVELVDQARDLKEDSEDILEHELTDTEAAPATEATPPPAVDAVVTVPPAYVPPRILRTKARNQLLSQIADIDPLNFTTDARRAVSTAWRSLHSTTDTIAKMLKLDPDETGLNAIAVALVNRGLLSKNSALIAFRLAELHHSLLKSRDRDISLDVIANFLETSANLQQILDKILDDLRQLPRE